MRKIRLGVIGAGEFAEACHLPGLQSHPQAEIIALCGRTYERVRSLADRFSVSHVYTDYRELCRRDDVDAVTIVTPNVYHAQQASVAFNSGKHVFCEKPLGLNVTEARAMTATAEKSGRVHQVGFTFRYGYAVRELRRRIRAGDIGRPFYVRIQYDNWQGLKPDWKIDWRTKKELAGGGLLFDLGSHLFDVVRFVLGPIEAVTGFVENIRRRCPGKSSELMTEVETDDLAAAWFRQEQGVRGQLFISRITPPFAQNGYLEVIGEQGALKASLSRGSVDKLLVSAPMQPDWAELSLPAEASDGKPHSMWLMMRSFVDACLSGGLDNEFDASFYDGLAAQECIEQVLKSEMA
jgi:predicted dehydrogenase